MRLSIVPIILVQVQQPFINYSTTLYIQVTSIKPN